MQTLADQGAEILREVKSLQDDEMDLRLLMIEMVGLLSSAKGWMGENYMTTKIDSVNERARLLLMKRMASRD